MTPAATVNLDAELLKIDRFLELAEVEFLARVKSKTPVRTGTLRDGFESGHDSTSIFIGNDVEYFPYVENGTPFQSPQGMLRTTVEEAQQIADEIARKVNQ